MTKTKKEKLRTHGGRTVLINKPGLIEAMPLDLCSRWWHVRRTIQGGTIEATSKEWAEFVDLLADLPRTMEEAGIDSTAALRLLYAVANRQEKPTEQQLEEVDLLVERLALRNGRLPRGKKPLGHREKALLDALRGHGEHGARIGDLRNVRDGEGSRITESQAKTSLQLLREHGHVQLNGRRWRPTLKVWA